MFSLFFISIFLAKQLFYRPQFVTFNYLFICLFIFFIRVAQINQGAGGNHTVESRIGPGLAESDRLISIQLSLASEREHRLQLLLFSLSSDEEKRKNQTKRGEERRGEERTSAGLD